MEKPINLVALHDSLPSILLICDLLHSSDPRNQCHNASFTNEKVRFQTGYDLPVGLAVSNILGSAGLTGPVLSLGSDSITSSG